MKKLISLLLLVFLSVIMISCSENKIIVDSTFIDVYEGESRKMNLKYSGSVKIDISDESVCEVNADFIYAKGVGSADIRIYDVYDSSKYIIIKVIVKEIPKIQLIKDTVSVGEEVNCFETNVENLNWTSSDNEVATVNNGVVKGLKTGTVTIKAASSLITREFTVNVVSSTVLATSVTIVVNEKMQVNEDQLVTLNILPENYTSKPEITVSDNSILKLEASKLTALKAGKCELTVKIDSIVKKVTITVSKSVQDYFDYAFSVTGLSGFESIIFPYTDLDKTCEYRWETSNEDLIFIEDEFLNFVEYNEEADLTCILVLDGKEYRDTRKFTVIGTAFGDISTRFVEQFRALKIYKDMNLVTEFPNHYEGTKVVWESSDESIFNLKGEFNKPLEDTKITITYKVVLGNPKLEQSFSIDLSVEGKQIMDIEKEIIEWLDKMVPTDKLLDSQTVLPDFINEYNVILEWQDMDGRKLKLSDYTNNPIFSNGVNVKVKATFKGKSLTISRHYAVKPVGYENKWDLIKLFTDTIANKAVTQYSYNLVNWTSEENGYVYFYDTNDSNRIVDILPYTYGKQRTNIKKTSTEYIVVHDTGNPGSGANGLSHANYIKNLNQSEGSSYISWHFTVGDDGIYQHLPLDEVAYHAGDGSHVFGDTYFNDSFGAWSIGGGNRNGIGIESCIDRGCDYTQVMRYLAKLVAELLIEFNLGIDRVKQHNAFSGKNCPQVMRENNRWEEFLFLVQLELFAKMNFKDVKFEWISKSDLLNSNGKVNAYNKIGQTISYDVKVTYNGEVKTYSYNNIITKR